MSALFYTVDIQATHEVAAPQLPVPAAPPPTAIAFHLPSGRNLHFDSSMGPAALTALIRAVEAA